MAISGADKLISISLSSLKKGLITKQFIMIETIRYERALIAAGYTFENPFTRIEVNEIPSKKRSITLANTNWTGIVVINEIYLGTNCICGLRATILHELAHLIVGVDKRHSPVFKDTFKQLLNLFGLNLEEATREQARLYDDFRFKNPLKYRLYGILENGDKVFYRYAARKHTHYVTFQESSRTASCPSGKIVRFSYELS
jgi:predicted metal-dependent hydrolase